MIFKTHNILKLDQAALARHSDCVGNEIEVDNAYVTLKTKYITHPSTDG